MTSSQYRDSEYGDKTILGPLYLHNGIPYACNMTSLYWMGALNYMGYIILYPTIPKRNNELTVSITL